MKESITNKTDANGMLADLANDIVNLMIREHQSIHQELEHVGKLIGDASKSLTINFDKLNTIAARHNSLLENEDNTPAEDLKKNQLNIVTALQFDDIVQQLTKHSQSRTRHIQVMFKKLATYLDEIKNSDCQSASTFNARIIELKRDVNELRLELEKENPVKQSSLATGKTELF
jgi:hypothetical protein